MKGINGIQSDNARLILYPKVKEKEHSAWIYE